MAVVAEHDSTWIALEPRKVLIKPYSLDREIRERFMAISLHGQCFEPALYLDGGYAIEDRVRTISPGDLIGIEYLDGNEETQNAVKRYIQYDNGHIVVCKFSKTFRLPLYSVRYLARVSYITTSRSMLYAIWHLLRIWPNAGDRSMSVIFGQIEDELARQFDRTRTSNSTAESGKVGR